MQAGPVALDGRLFYPDRQLSPFPATLAQMGKKHTDHLPFQWTRVMAYAAAASCFLLVGVV